MKLGKITSAEHKNECKFSCAIYVVLFSIIFTINIGFGTYFIYYKYMNPSKNIVNNKVGSGIQTLIY